jgi:hypothetical protein
MTEREAEAFDEEKVYQHLKNSAESQTQEYAAPTKPQWPIKLNLVPLKAPFFENANLLVTADCVPVAIKNFHSTLLPGKTVIIGCPKFDDARAYAQKLGEILKQNSVVSITVTHMEVPCCSALKWVVDKALEASGKKIPVKELEVKIGGEVVEL